MSGLTPGAETILADMKARGWVVRYVAHGDTVGAWSFAKSLSYCRIALGCHPHVAEAARAACRDADEPFPASLAQGDDVATQQGADNVD